jgi:glutamate racemase
MHSPARATIGIFDSGVGGLSILAALRRHLPHCRFLYVCDQAYFPYGLKSEEDVVTRVSTLCAQVLEGYSLDYVVVACNTASTVVLPTLRQQVELPVIGVVPAIKPAAELSKTKVIGMIATPGTITRPYTQELIANFAADCQVVQVGSNRLVDIAEAKLAGEPIDSEEIRQILTPLSNNPQLDTLVLACTHFPHLAEEIAQSFARPVQLVESSEGVARRVVDLINKETRTLTAANEPDLFLSTGSPRSESLITRFGFSQQVLL